MSGNKFQKFEGDDRRVHKVFITKNTEYHVRKGTIVAVRPRGSKEWLASHQALDMQIEGCIPNGSYLPTASVPKPGMRLYLATAGNDVVTSPVVAIVRPPKTTVTEYPVPEKA